MLSVSNSYLANIVFKTINHNGQVAKHYDCEKKSKNYCKRVIDARL